MSSTATDDVAAGWIAKRESDSWTSQDEVELNAWLEASTFNRVAFLRMRATWDKTVKLASVASADSRGRVPARGSWDFERILRAESPDSNAQQVLDAQRLRPTRSWRWAAGLAAACIALVVALFALNAGLLSGRQYSTAVGKSERITLSDGSQMTLNTDSRVRVNLTHTERRVTLNQGEVYFQIAKDARRPFVVQIGDARVLAVGTQFAIRRQPDEIVLMVTEGAVRVERLQPVTNEAGGMRPSMVATAGNLVQILPTETKLRVQETEEIERLLRWRNGYISFENITLREAVAEFNRYTTRRIVVRDAELSDIRLSGNFRTNNVDGFLALLEDGFGVRIEDDGFEVSLRRN